MCGTQGRTLGGGGGGEGGEEGDAYGGGWGGEGGVGGCREGMQVFGKRRRKMGRENVGKM